MAESVPLIVRGGLAQVVNGGVWSDLTRERPDDEASRRHASSTRARGVNEAELELGALRARRGSTENRSILHNRFSSDRVLRFWRISQHQKASRALAIRAPILSRAHLFSLFSLSLSLSLSLCLSIYLFPSSISSNGNSPSGNFCQLSKLTRARIRRWLAT